MSKTGERSLEPSLPTWRDLLLGERRVATWAICLGVALHAFNWFVVNTATPSAVLELGRADLLSWVTAFYLVFSILGSSGAAFLKSRIGLRALLPGATLALILGCAVIAFAPSMHVVLVGRIIQGVAEGVIYALSYIIAAEVVGHRALPALWALLALVWALATILGPIAAGILIELWSWRVAAAALIVPAIMFVQLGLKVLPRMEKPPEGQARWPIGRLACLAVGSLALCIASETGGFQALLVSAAALGLIFIGLLLDRYAVRGLFPRRLLGFDTPSVQGLWLLALMLIADASVFMFAPFIVQVHFGMPALVAGQIASLTAIGWSVSALIVAKTRQSKTAALVVAGPTSLAIGLGAIAGSLSLHSLVGMSASLFVIGIGFGVSHGFISQRTIAHSEKGEEDVTSGGIPTVEGLGSSVGAALAGIVATTAGFPAMEVGLHPFVVTATTGAAIALPAIFLALKFVTAGPSPTPARHASIQSP